MTTEEILPRFEQVSRNGAGWMARCPAHEDRNPSLSIKGGDDGRTLLHCHAGCTAEAVCSSLGLKLADLGPARLPNGNAKEIVATYDYTDEAGELLSQALRLAPKDFRQRRPDPSSPDGWSWSTKSVRRVLFRLPKVINGVQDGSTIHVVEGEKDVLSLESKGLVATCNIGGAGKWQDSYSDALAGAYVLVIADKDEPGRKHAQKVAESLKGRAASVRVIEVPDHGGRPCKDVSDFIAAGGDVAELERLKPVASEADKAKEERRRKLKDSFSIRSIRELLAMTFDPADFLLENGYMTKGDPLVIAGQGGLGKSRFVMQLGICCTAGLPFLGWKTNARNSRWLFLQTENSNRRLQADLAAMVSALPPEAIDHLNEKLRFHTLEQDDDSFVSLSNEATIERIGIAIEDFDPHVVVFDVLRDFAIGDLNGDSDMAATCRAIGRLTRKGNSKRVPLIVHHALTGKAGAAKASGFDRASFGRNSKNLQSWTRAQINLAPYSADNNDVLVVASGKSNNSREFEPFAARLNPECFMYVTDSTVDLSDWRESLGISERKGPIAQIADVVKAVSANGDGASKGDIVRAVMAETGISKSPAYRLIDSADAKKAIIRRKSDGLYVLPR